MEGELMIDVLMFVFTGLILLVGWLVRDHHSGYPDTFCGYHVGGIAAKSGEAWEDANRWCGGAFLKCGSAFLFLDAAAALTFRVMRAEERLPGLPVSYLMAAILVPTALSIVWTERRLKQKYNPDGTLK
ncbi:hypothetical protein CAFE_07920 [Caprobacter fermentans]|uniref:SdpI family protein n=1 Tax=Caproicibacter fermentans TaxID=2576756 RepID=A0A6N8HX86_9FIRM|nr:hypothetical protein [Caproicibacter fermentans]MVB10117.1 hypothetical protein [Caproicibacter fermentans]QNK40187.1 hypothetical protein HCR03_16105 [Caproicibacter fermentans]